MRAAVLANPVLLGYSLKKRLQPRVALCNAVGVSPSIVLSLHAYSDERFSKACERACSSRWDAPLWQIVHQLLQTGWAYYDEGPRVGRDTSLDDEENDAVD